MSADSPLPPATPARPPDVARALPTEDDRWMAFALEEARLAARLGEVPVGAVIVRAGRIIAAAHNLTRTDADPTAHAEMLAIRQAAAALGDWRLLECTLYVTLEPCAMCCGAIILARIPRVVYGADDPKAGMASSLANLLEDPRLNHRVDLTGGVRAVECGGLLKDFFRARRNEGFPARRRP